MKTWWCRWCRGGDEPSTVPRPRRPYRRTVVVGLNVRTCAVGVILLVCLQTDLSTSRRMGQCVSDGVQYSPGERIPTKDPCLECICTSDGGGGGFTDVRCRLRVCPRLPRPPPPSCLLLRRPNACCERLVCSDGLKNTIQGRSNIESELQQQFHEGCVLNGTVYGEGSAMGTSSLCEYCYCIKGKQHCVRPQCILSVSGCIPEYSKHSCCPVKYNCTREIDAPSSTPPSTSGKCEVDGETFPEGSRLGKMELRPCEKCYCLKGHVHCDPVVCDLAPFPNCSPVTQEGHCCPVSYNCSSSQPAGTTEQVQELPVTTTASTEIEEKTTATTEAATEPGVETTTLTSSLLDNTGGGGIGDGTAEERSITTTSSSSSDDETTTSTTLARDELLDVGNSTELYKGKLKVTPEVIEAIINRTLEKEDYDYDYNEPSLPPSLPNLKIIPFVAADAMIRQNEEDPLYSAAEPLQVTSKSTEAPPTLTFSPAVSRPVGFSPPTETEGGFLPRDPVIDGPFYESKYIASPAEVALVESSLPAITESPKLVEKGNCDKNGKSYSHGEVVNESSACNLCVCYYGTVHCQQSPCNDTNCAGELCSEEIKTATPASVLPEILPELPKAVTVAEIVVTPKPLSDLPTEAPPPPPVPSANATTDFFFVNLTKNGFDYDDISLGNIFDILFSSEPSTKQPANRTTSALSPSSTTPAPVSSTDSHLDPSLNSIAHKETEDIDRISLNHSDDNLISSHQQNQASNPDLQLKLAGCNIYGKMYQVGDFIAELSTSCSKCKCADSGVQCHEVDC